MSSCAHNGFCYLSLFSNPLVWLDNFSRLCLMVTQGSLNTVSDGVNICLSNIFRPVNGAVSRYKCWCSQPCRPRGKTESWSTLISLQNLMSYSGTVKPMAENFPLLRQTLVMGEGCATLIQTRSSQAIHQASSYIKVTLFLGSRPTAAP